jgi:hypothetical protein
MLLVVLGSLNEYLKNVWEAHLSPTRHYLVIEGARSETRHLAYGCRNTRLVGTSKTRQGDLKQL